ncbi:hypothetical protein [Synechococcus sp. BS55D]|uniref:hypothetical protein n=1 Tax=Synechococcus sp. BS55D TaxID=2055943 RepID=UPI001F36EA36|nr:hypothetical protein [Synechococcus sp. BS55D]
MAPRLYREQALYLQILRDLLLPAVRASLATLLTADDGQRLAAIDVARRAEIQARIDALVQRCCSLLTIEQLMDLSRQISREQVVRVQQAQKALLEDRPTDAVHPERSPTDSGPRATQSIQLSLDPPIHQPSLLQGLLPTGGQEDSEIDLAELEKADHEQADHEQADHEESPTEQSVPEETEIEDDDSLQSEWSGQGATSDLAMLRSLFVMAGQAMVAAESSGGSELDSWPRSLPSTEAGSGLLPAMPRELVRWLDGLDRALLRRLRNLSHALNVELMRSGLASSLLPISLLDAALSGQVESLPAASNLLRLRVPLPEASVDQWVELSCLLLRPSELEFDHAELRRCRMCLRHRRRELLTMVQKQRHWQRRSTIRQVQEQWWPSPPSDPQMRA